MTVIKKKVTRKEELNQPDAFIGAANEAAEWYTDHKKQVVTAIVVGCAAILGVWGSLQIIDHNKEVASRSYFEVQKVLDANVGENANYVAGLSEAQRKVQKLGFTNEEDRTRALSAALDKVVSENGNNDVGNIAKLRKAILLQEQNKDKEAIEVLKDYLAKTNQKDSLREVAIEHLGYAYEANNELDQAAAQFSLLEQSNNSSMKEAANYHNGRIAVLKNDAAKAKEYFQKVIDEADKDGLSAYADMAKAQLAAIN